MLLSDSREDSAGFREAGQGRRCPDVRGRPADLGHPDEESAAGRANTSGMRRIRVLRSLAVAGAVCTVAACGSTVQMGPAAVGAQNGQGLSAPTGVPGPPGAVATAGGSVPGVTGGVVPAAAGGAATGTTNSGTTSGGSAAGKRTTSRSGVVSNAAGVTSTTMYMGVGYSSQTAAGDRAI